VRVKLGLPKVPKPTHWETETLQNLFKLLPADMQTQLLEKVKQFRRAAPDLSIDLSNMDDLSYVAKIYIGSNKQGLDVIYDTGSDYLVVQADDCSNCVSDKFIPSQSTTYEVIDASTKT
jgi:hypothetical protein